MFSSILPFEIFVSAPVRVTSRILYEIVNIVAKSNWCLYIFTTLPFPLNDCKISKGAITLTTLGGELLSC